MQRDMDSVPTEFYTWPDRARESYLASALLRMRNGSIPFQDRFYKSIAKKLHRRSQSSLDRFLDGYAVTFIDSMITHCEGDAPLLASTKLCFIS